MNRRLGGARRIRREASSRENGATRRARRFNWNPVVWLQHHVYTLISSLGRIWLRPLTGVMNVAVIAIALALPAAMYVTVSNMSNLGQRWDRVGDVALFLHVGIETPVVLALSQQLEARADVARIEVMNPDQALADFSSNTELAPTLEALTDNPLPYVLVLTPAEQLEGRQASDWAAQFESLEAVDFAQFDMEWLNRFHALIDIALRAAWVIGALFVAGVMLIVGNTIRMEIQNRRDEIEVIKMLGGTDGFVRRPFLYGGAWYGVLGGLLAWILVAAAIGALTEPVSALAMTYQSQFELNALAIEQGLALVTLGGVIGWLGSWLAVGRQLASIQPA